MKVKKSSSLMILVLMLSSVAIGFLGFAVLTFADTPPVGDTEAIDLGYKIRDAKYGLDTNLEALSTSSGIPRSSANSYWEEGESAIWLFLDDYLGAYYLAYFQLRKIGTIAEVWVQVDLSYGDARDDPWNLNDLGHYTYPEVTDDQILYLLGEFENNIYSSVTGVFGEPDPHDGLNAAIDDMLGLPPDYYYEETGRNVILVSNIRDTQYYDPDYPYFIGGFFTGSFEFYFDRNIISIDSNQWYRRMGPENTQWWSYARDQLDPPVERINMYETLIGHEYQHLVHADYNPADPSFMNEACSMYAETILGYPWETGDIESFLATPDNSLTAWGDQGGINILADYGAAFLWALYLSDHFGGADFLGHFVQAGIPGIEGVTAALDYFHYPLDFDDVFLDWRIANLIHSDHPGYGRYNYESVDLGALDQETRVYDVDGEQYGTDFGNTITILDYDTGIAMIGSYGTDYIRFDDLRKLALFTFDGDDGAFVPGWERVPDGWYSGADDLYNTLITTAVEVTVGDPTLELTTYWDIEALWDFGFVQVATDGVGDWYSEWTSLENEYTTDDHDPQAHPNAVANLPGLTGWSGDLVTMTFDLSDYAGQTIHLGFRYVTDWAFVYEGWYLYNVIVSGEEYIDALDHAYPDVSFMVTIIEAKECHGKMIYYIDDMWIFDIGDYKNLGFDFAVISKKEIAYLLVSPIMDIGMADYKFDAYSFRTKWKR